MKRKIVINEPGAWDALEVTNVEPEPLPAGHVRVAVAAIGVNFADCMVRMGLYESAKKYGGYPLVPGFEAAGFIAEVGEGVSGWRPGERVIALTRFGAYAEELIVPVEQIFALPVGWSLLQGAAFSVVHVTAWYAMHPLANVRPGQKVLVHSAAGGVGGALCTLARLHGCEVTGVVGYEHKRNAAFAMGAHRVRVSSSRVWDELLRDAPEGFHAIFDANGSDSLRRSYRLLASPGKLVVYGFHRMLKRGYGRPFWPGLILEWLRTPRFNPLRMTGENRSVLAFNLSYLFEEKELLASGMHWLLQQASSGYLAAPELDVHPFEQVADAHRALESGNTTGKLVLDVRVGTRAHPSA